MKSDLKILLVEDSKTFAEYIVSLLGEANYEVIIAHTGEVGIDFLNNSTYNLVLLDMHLPDSNGLDIVKIIRKNHKQNELPVVFISATTDEQIITKALEAGANDFIQKPFTEITLKIKIKNLLELQQASEHLLDMNRCLKESEEKYRLIFENSPIGLISYNEKGIVTACNESLSQIIGTPQKKLIGLNMLELPDKKLVEAVNNSIVGNIGQYEDYYHSVTSKKITAVKTQFVPMLGNSKTIQGGLGIVRDITEQKQADKASQQAELRLKRLVDILQHPSESVTEFLDYSLEQVIQITGSKIGYIYHYNEERKEFVLNTWSKEVMPACAVINQRTVYALDETGIWGEAVRQRKPIIVNDFQAKNPLKKGLPEGHIKLHNFMTIPIFRNNYIVGVIGVANKEGDYGEADILQLSLVMESVWKVTERIEAEEDLKKAIEKTEKSPDFAMQTGKELVNLHKDKLELANLYIEVGVTDWEIHLNKTLYFSKNENKPMVADEGNAVKQNLAINNNNKQGLRAPYTRCYKRLLKLIY